LFLYCFYLYYSELYCLCSQINDDDDDDRSDSDTCS